MRTLRERFQKIPAHSTAVLLLATLVLPYNTAHAVPPTTVAEGANPSQTGEAARSQSANFLSRLGNRVSQQRSTTLGSPGNSKSAARGAPLGGAASSDAGGIKDFSRLSAFGIQDFAESERDKTDAGLGFGAHTYSSTVGLDYRVNESLFAGANVSYVTGETDIDGNVASTDLDLFVFGLHGSKYWKNNLFVDWLATYGWLEQGIERFDGVGNFEADADGDQRSVEISLGYQFSKERWRITPIAKAFHLRGQIDSYTERKVSSAGTAKVVDRQHFDSSIVDLSTQIERVFLADWGVLVPSVNLTVRREFADADTMTGRSVSSATSRFSEKPDDPDNTTAIVRLGISAQFRHGLSAFASYEQVFAHDFMDRYNAVVGVRYEIPSAYHGSPHPNPGPRR